MAPSLPAAAVFCSPTAVTLLTCMAVLLSPAFRQTVPNAVWLKARWPIDSSHHHGPFYPSKQMRD